MAAEDEVARRKRRFFLIRVAILLFILFLVVLYAVRDIRSREARREWDRTLDVAVVLVHDGRRPPPDPEAIRRLEERTDALEERLLSEASRYRPGIVKPVRVKLFGPVSVSSPPPTTSGDGALDLAKQAAAMARWVREVDPKAGVDPDHWDTRIYVSVHRPLSEKRSFVEGQSEVGGRIGVVDVELDPSMADLTLFVVTHELMHTLGASDKYDAAGRTLVPAGLAEPTRSPLYPQRFAEVMARNRPVSPGKEVIPLSLDELAVGAETAREIGWAH